MAYQGSTQRGKDICEGVFEWKIDHFNQFIRKERERIASPEFHFRRHKCHLFIPERDDSCPICLLYFQFCLYGADITEFSDKTIIYKYSIVGRHGKEFLETQFTPLQMVPPNIILTILHSNYLTDNWDELMPGGTLTFRLSWHETIDPIRKRDTDEERYLTSGKEMNTYETLSKDFKRFYENQTDTDCVLRVGETQFPVHRLVLSARSDVFGAMFRHDTSENRSGVVDIPDVDATIMSDILHYVYSGHIRGLTSDSAAPMYIAADKYGMVELKDICLDFLMLNLTLGNFYASSVLAHTYGEVVLQSKIVQFMGVRLEEVKESEGWKTLSNIKPSLAIDLLCSTVFAYKEMLKYNV